MNEVFELKKYFEIPENLTPEEKFVILSNDMAEVIYKTQKESSETSWHSRCNCDSMFLVVKIEWIA